MSEAKKESMGMLALMLFLITFITALLLGFVNQVTAPQIAKNNEATRAAAMAEIIPDAEFVEAEPSEVPAPDKETPAIQNIYEAQKDGETVGYCMEVLPSGFGGTLTVVVGINTDGTVAGAKVTSHAETPGLGAKAQSDPTWIVQFAGQAADGSLAVTKDGGTINSITGATITSRAVTLAVNTAASYVQSLAA
ncbi:RnfABCDGE type electron transport complex subunit G [Intestinibacillus sp. Marseille-P6563]|uniref:RnfABCDGE type electron transport complex subunit G n=1 Tax=Intestinibacillus sp. Marseille-P6563 TaxID=2364792 RepID=UPI0013E00246|nr:RnfABCDGE type electron transport complex subunit G [Intestinibacillus sp. Marseille-P6563]